MFPKREGSMCTVVMRDSDAPPGSKAASCIEGDHRNMRGPIGSAGLVSGGGRSRGTAGAAFRAEIGSRTGS